MAAIRREIGYSRGLHEVGAGANAYLSPPGSWGFSNCGVVVDGGHGLLVDTQFSLPPTRTFRGRLEVAVGERVVELIEVGPAPTHGDVLVLVLVHVPDAGVVFAGDILFNGGHPIKWAGPVGNWIAACALILATGAATIVPGHGAVMGSAEVAVFRGCLKWVAERAAEMYADGRPYWQVGAVPDDYRDWGNPERLVITMAAAYRSLGEEPHDLMAVLARTAEAAR